MLHSKLGASSAKRWMNCPGSVQLIDSLKEEEKSSSAAALGTAAHALGETCLIEDTEPWMHEGEEFDGFEVDAEMVEAVTVYVDYVRLCVDKCVNPDVHIEAKVTLHQIDESMFGTCDCLIWDEDTGHLFVLDYKHGAGVYVGIEGNPQLRYYALGAVELLDLYDKVKTITVGIVQPRCVRDDDTPIRTMDLIPEDLWSFREELVEAVRCIKSKDAAFTEGDWCQFCKAKSACPARTAAMHKEAVACFAKVDELAGPVYNLPAPDSVTPEQRTKILDILDPLKKVMKWIEEVQDAAMKDHQDGVHTPHYDCVPTRKTRKWRNEKEAAEALKKLGEDAYTRKLKSVAAMSKITEVPEDLIETKQGWTLKRVEETSIEAAIRDFESLIEE